MIRKHVLDRFWVGFALVVFYNATVQDILGKEKYVSAISTFWLNSPWWVWPLLFLGFCTVIVLNEKYSSKDVVYVKLKSVKLTEMIPTEHENTNDNTDNRHTNH